MLRFAKASAVKRKVNAAKRIVSRRVKAAGQRVKLASRMAMPVNRKVTLAETLVIDQTHARPKGIVNRKLIANRKLVVTVIDVRQKGDAHRKETDVVRVAMLVVVRPMGVGQEMVNGVVSCRGSLNCSTAITMARSAAMNWIV